MKHRTLQGIIKMKYDRQIDFAEKVGQTELQVSQVINGRRGLSREEKARWSQVLNTPLRLLFPDEKEVGNG